MQVDIVVNNSKKIDVTINRGTLIFESVLDLTDNANIDLVSGVSYEYPNPFTLPIKPRFVDLLSPSGDNLLKFVDITIDQTTGDISIYSGTSYTNAILNIQGW